MDGLAIRINIGLALWDPGASHLVIVALIFCGVKVDNELARVYVVIQSINCRFFLIWVVNGDGTADQTVSLMPS